MISNIYFESAYLDNLLELDFLRSIDKIIIKLKERYKKIQVEEISLTLEFENDIKAYRSQQYNWEEYTGEVVSLNSHSPKIIIFENELHMFSSSNVGAWVIEDKRRIKWILKSSVLTPVFQYAANARRIFETAFDIENYELEVLFTKQEVPEFSRSKIPFKPIICFTDHCDFDDDESLETQLSFFKEYGIKISKGFFLNHFSKREFNSSFERSDKIIKRFQTEGHGLFYHALTQSLRHNDDALDEFKNFVPPTELKVNTYIDHGYQIYNLTKRSVSGLSDVEWSNIMEQKGIQNFWTYLDSGSGANGVINQLNPKHFSYGHMLRSNPFDLKYLVRSILFYCGNEDYLLIYREIAKQAKQLIQGKSLVKFFPLIRNISKVGLFIIKSFLFHRDKVFRYSVLTPFIFKVRIGEKIFNLFQTIEVTNFEKTFTPSNIDILERELGAIIVHCYFSSSLKHQKGRLFKNGRVSDKNKANFNYLKEKIQANGIWNPSIDELIDYTDQINKMKYKWDENERKFVSSDPNIPVRYVRYV